MKTTKQMVFISVILISLIVRVDCQGAIPDDPWGFESIDISGAVNPNNVVGSTTYDPDTETYTVTAGGGDIWLEDDGFRYVYLEVPAEVGDFEVSARLAMPVSWPHAWAKAGIMVRQDLDADSVHATLGAARDSGVEMQHRATKGAAASHTGAAERLAPYANGTNQLGINEPIWLKLERQGDLFLGYYSYDGVEWRRDSPWGENSMYTVVLEGAFYVGFCFSTHEANIEGTASFGDFNFPPLAGTRAVAGPDQWVYGDEEIALDGRKSTKADTYQWTQIKEPGDPDVPITNPTQAVATITPPGTEVGYPLTFRLTVTGETGTDSDEIQVFVRAINPPKVAPSNLRVMPLDLGDGGLGCNVEWDPLVDAAEGYQIGLKFDSTIQWIEVIQRTNYQSGGMLEGDTRTIAIRGRNKYGTSDEPAAIAEVSYTAMPNIALGASGYVFLGDTDPVGMNNGATDDSTSSVGLSPDITTYWGYTWDEVRFFDNIVYYTGNMTGSGGWFTGLIVQVTQDGTTWQDVPILGISPAMDFSDQRQGKEAFTRYDIDFPAVQGTGIRICGTPADVGLFTSVAELQVWGDQTRPPDTILAQGIDATFPEGGTATLNGSLSFSLAGPITSYAWTGPLTINNADQAVASFDAPIVAVDEVLVFSVTVGDGTNTDTDDDVRITVRNLATAAVAGVDQTALEGTEVILDGSGSTTTTGTLTYLWTQTGGTDVGVSGSTTETVTFTAPTIWNYTEELTFSLQVNDGAGGLGTDVVVIEVGNSLAWPVYPLVGAPNTGRIQDMLHLGKYPSDRILGPLNINNDPLAEFAGQANVNPVPGEQYDFTDIGVTVTRNPMIWTPIHYADGVFGDEPLDEFEQIYHVYIISPQQRDARFHFFHDDEIRIWNNGMLVAWRDGWNDVTEQAEDFVLHKGLNSVTMKFEDGGGGNWIAVRITDQSDISFDDLYYSFGPSLFLSDAYAMRTLPRGSYEAGVPVDVTLAVKVNEDQRPSSVTVVEQIPEGLSEPYGDAIICPGATIIDGQLRWEMSGDAVKNTTLTYSLTPPAGLTQALVFSGTVSFPGDSSDIFGGSVMYAVPTAPRYLEVDMFQAAVVSWSAPVTPGTSSYTVYRSVNGGAWEEVATTTNTSYFDRFVVPGENYSYQVSATNVVGSEGPTSRPTAQATPLTTAEVEQDRVIREAEDFNYDSGEFPWTDSVTLPAIEAPDATTIGAPEEYDYWHPSTGGPGERIYRLLDNTPEGLAINIEEDVDNPGVYHTKIGWTDDGAWWRYTFNVTQAGWVNFAFRVAAPNPGAIAAYWDEVFVGTVTFQTGDWNRMLYVVLEDQVETDVGEHTLRVLKQPGDLDFDKIALGFDWTPPKRKTIWEDDFDSYTANSEVFDPAVGGWTKQTAGYPDGAWQLWNTAVEPDVAGMKDGYMISNSDLSGEDAPLDEQLISPQIDTSDYTKLRLNFNWNYQNYLVDPDDPQIAEVDLRVKDNDPDPWGDWINLLHLDLDSVPIDLDPAILSGTDVHDLSAYDGKTIQIRFHYYDAEWDYWFAVDTIRVSGIQPEIRAGIIGLSLVGDQLTLDWEPHGSYYIEHTTDLTGTWADLPGVPVTGTTAVVTIPAGAEGYYRLRAAE